MPAPALPVWRPVMRVAARSDVNASRVRATPSTPRRVLCMSSAIAWAQIPHVGERAAVVRLTRTDLARRPGAHADHPDRHRQGSAEFLNGTQQHVVRAERRPAVERQRLGCRGEGHRRGRLARNDVKLALEVEVERQHVRKRRRGFEQRRVAAARGEVRQADLRMRAGVAQHDVDGLPLKHRRARWRSRRQRRGQALVASFTSRTETSTAPSMCLPCIPAAAAAAPAR